MDCVGPKQIFQLDSETRWAACGQERLETFIYCAVGLFFSLIFTMVAMLSVALYLALTETPVSRAKKYIK